jgi:type I restriction enzyme S subunit
LTNDLPRHRHRDFAPGIAVLPFDAEAADAARLRRYILKAAFEGRLVPQDPADEPASVLLARLQATGSTVPARRGRTRKGS